MLSKTTTLSQPRRRTDFGAVVRRARIYRSQVMRHYTDWRVGATKAEKTLYKTSPSIVLSFDDYGTKQQVERLLATLETAKIRAAFFPQGDWAEQNPTLLASIRAKGHIVGNHTYGHRDLLSLSDNQVLDEISCGIISPLLRPPMGRYNDRIRRLAASLGQAIAYWSIDSDDWKGVSAAYMQDKIMRQLHPGAVILFHLGADNSAYFLPELITQIRRRGYDFLGFEEPFYGETS